MICSIGIINLWINYKNPVIWATRVTPLKTFTLQEVGVYMFMEEQTIQMKEPEQCVWWGDSMEWWIKNKNRNICLSFIVSESRRDLKSPNYLSKELGN